MTVQSHRAIDQEDHPVRQHRGLLQIVSGEQHTQTVGSAGCATVRECVRAH